MCTTKPTFDTTNTRWILRVTEHKNKPSPVFVTVERSSKLKSSLYGQSLRRCLPVIRLIISHVCDDAGVPLELHKTISGSRITFRGDLPLDDEAGAKLMLLFKLSQRVQDVDRVELMAWRIERFTAEEALYWLTRITCFESPMDKWAIAGLRIILAGKDGDSEVQKVLENLRR